MLRRCATCSAAIILASSYPLLRSCNASGIPQEPLKSHPVSSLTRLSSASPSHPVSSLTRLSSASPSHPVSSLMRLSSASPFPPGRAPPDGFHLHVVAPDGLRVPFGILLPNVLVYLAWQVRGLQGLMQHFFLTHSHRDYSSGSPAINSVRWLLSTYSHSHVLHLGANMLGLFSFAPACLDGRETPRTPKLSPLEFMGMYTAAGVAASLGSSVYNFTYGAGRPGLGASGSIFGVLTFSVLSYPESRVLALFIIETSAEYALTGLTLLNLFMARQEYLAGRGRGE
jgi:membrane associated rhomboid family serine protease